MAGAILLLGACAKPPAGASRTDRLDQRADGQTAARQSPAEHRPTLVRFPREVIHAGSVARGVALLIAGGDRGLVSDYLAAVHDHAACRAQAGVAFVPNRPAALLELAQARSDELASFSADASVTETGSAMAPTTVPYRATVGWPGDATDFVDVVVALRCEPDPRETSPVRLTAGT
jgi:hypothetical protein